MSKQAKADKRTLAAWKLANRIQCDIQSIGLNDIECLRSVIRSAETRIRAIENPAPVGCIADDIDALNAINVTDEELDFTDPLLNA